jgi:hypothetical protein
MARTVETSGKPDIGSISTDDFGFRAFALWVLQEMQEEELQKNKEKQQ